MFRLRTKLAERRWRRSLPAPYNRTWGMPIDDRT